MDHIENAVVIDSIWHHNKLDYQHENDDDKHHYCFDCGDDIEHEGYELDGEFVCKHCCLDRCIIHSWGEVS